MNFLINKLDSSKKIYLTIKLFIFIYTENYGFILIYVVKSFLLDGMDKESEASQKVNAELTQT